jgi:hypothetical protein
MDTKNTPFSNGAGDLISLMSLAGLFGFGDFGAAFGQTSDVDEALEGHMANLCEKLIELNVIVASLLGIIQKGIPTKNLLDMNITRLRSIAEDIVISHKLYAELHRATAAEAPPENPEPQN